ncbi:MAG: NfeD family protein, partial [Bacteroidia bacterium]
LAENWEILLFVLGIVLVALEVFVIPGFGVAGISGILLVLGSLILSMINNVNFDFSGTNDVELNNAMASVLFAILGLFGVMYFFGSRFIDSKMFQRLVINDTIEGQVNIQQENLDISNLKGQTGIANTALRPMGRISIDDVIYEAKTFGEFIDKGADVQVIGTENRYVIVSSLTT